MIVRFFMVATGAALLLACGDPSSVRPDGGHVGTGGPACQNDLQCSDGLFCVDARCTDVCAAVPGGTPCNVGFASSTDIPACCAPGAKCCEDGFEHESCFSGDEPCPQACPNVFWGTCPVDQICYYEGDPTWDSGGHCDYQATHLSCVDSCPLEQQCGRICCGTGTVCMGSCCVVPSPADAGLPDAT
jgi:hypothetical protein